jgi:hypothetical protein
MNEEQPDSGGLAQPYSHTARMPNPWQFHGWAAANSPGMFTGHSEIVAFLFYRFDADKPAPLLRRWILALYLPIS